MEKKIKKTSFFSSGSLGTNFFVVFKRKKLKKEKKCIIIVKSVIVLCVFDCKVKKESSSQHQHQKLEDMTGGGDMKNTSEIENVDWGGAGTNYTHVVR